MGRVVVIRHAQASVHAEDCDQLSELGLRQSERLAQFLRLLGNDYSAVVLMAQTGKVVNRCWRLKQPCWLGGEDKSVVQI